MTSMGLRQTMVQEREDKELLADAKPLSPYSEILKIEVQPAELFQDNKGKVLQIAGTNNITTVIRRVGEAAELVIYDESGRKIDPKQRFDGIGLRASDILRAAKKMYGNFREFVTLEPGQGCSVAKILEELKVKADPEQVRVQLLKVSGKKDYNTPTVSFTALEKNKDMVLHFPEISLRNDKSEARIIFDTGTELLIYDTKDKEDKLLPPEQWKVIRMLRNARIPQNHLTNHPYLREVADSWEGKINPALERRVRSENGVLSVTDLKKNERLFTLACDAWAVDPSDNDTIYCVVPDAKAIKRFKLSEVAQASTPVTVMPLAVEGKVGSLRFESQGNFLVLVNENQGKGRLLVLEKDELKIAFEIGDVKSQIDLDNLGHIYFVDSEGRLRLAQTNFNSFPKGGLDAFKKNREKELTVLPTLVSSIDPDKVEKTFPREKSERELIAELGREMESKFGRAISAAKSELELDKVSSRIEAVREDARFRNYPKVFEPVEERIQERRMALQVDQLQSGLDTIDGLLRGMSSIGQAPEIDRVWSNLVRERGRILVKDVTLRKAIDGRIETLSEEKQRKYASLEGGIDSTLAAKFKEIESRVRECGNNPELRALMGDNRILEFHELRSILKDPACRAKWQQKYDEVISKKQSEISEKIRAEEKVSLNRAQEVLDEARGVFSQIEAALEEEVKDAKLLPAWTKTHPLVKVYRARLLTVPEGIRNIEERRLTSLLSKKESVLLGKESCNNALEVQAGTREFGGERFPIFQPSVTEQKIWKPPFFNAQWVVNAFTEGLLSKIARLAKNQLERQEKILILEGEAGSGKNILIDIFGHFVNRPVYTFTANYQNVKEDLTYDYGFSPEKGTFRDDSKLLKALQTPGAIVVFDEINTLPPGLAKMLNSLFDYRRALYLPDGRIIKADPTVLLMGAMNPQHYVGVQRLSQELLSRARVLRVDYPPEKHEGKRSPFEAEMLAKHVEVLKALKQDEFHAVWHAIINGDRANGADKLRSAEVDQAVRNLGAIVRTANKVREAYRAFHTRKSNDIIEFVFSLRESIDVAYELNSTPNVKEAIKHVVLPKVAEPTEAERVAAIIDNV